MSHSVQPELLVKGISQDYQFEQLIIIIHKKFQPELSLRNIGQNYFSNFKSELIFKIIGENY